MRTLRSLLPLVSAAALLACGSDEAQPPAPTGGDPPACTVGELRLDDGTCVAPGVPADLPCPAGDSPTAEGGCEPAGVAADDCAPGFFHDDFGCHPIEPEAPCGPSTIALPGETRCREVMPCGSGPWGDLETDETTQFVDASYAGADSDGTEARPWISIQQGVDGAGPGGSVVVAEGTYTENIVISDPGLRLWGRCPSLVHVVGAAAGSAALKLANADGALVGGLAVEGAGPGVAASRGSITLDRVHIRDTAAHGVVAVGDLGETHVTLTASLVEGARQVGVFVEDADVLVDRTVVRGTVPQGASPSAGLVAQSSGTRPARLAVDGSTVEDNVGFGILAQSAIVDIDGTLVRRTMSLPGGSYGRGVEVSTAGGGGRSTLSLTRSVLDHNTQAGLRIDGSDAQVEATVVRDTQPDGAGALGRGVDLAGSAAGGAVLTLSRTLISGNHDGGIVVSASSVTLVATRVRDTFGADNWGGGVEVQSDGGVPSSAEVRTSVIERSLGLGVHVLGSTLLMEASVVRDTGVWIDDARGVMVASNPLDGLRSTATVASSLFERNAVLGVQVLASDADLDSIAVLDTQPGPTGEARAIGIEADLGTGARAAVTGRSILVRGSSAIGVYVGGADVTLEASAIHDTRARSDGAFGDGIAVVGSTSIPTLTTLTNTLVSESARASLSNFGAAVVFGSNDFACSGFDLEGEAFGDSPFSFEHRGGNRCGCPATADCQVLSSGLAPPPALPAFGAD